jgi:hypothetical protein
MIGIFLIVMIIILNYEKAMKRGDVFNYPLFYKVFYKEKIDQFFSKASDSKDLSKHWIFSREWLK